MTLGLAKPNIFTFRPFKKKVNSWSSQLIECFGIRVKEFGLVFMPSFLDLFG